MKKITQQELDKIIADHQIFLETFLELNNHPGWLNEYYEKIFENKDLRNKAAYIKDANLSGLDFSNADLRHSHFSGCNLSKANLSNVDFSHANLFHNDLTGAIMLKTKLLHTYLADTIFRGVIM